MAGFQKSLPKDALFVKVTRTIARPVSETFAYVVPVDVTHIFPRNVNDVSFSRAYARHHGTAPIAMRTSGLWNAG